HGQLYRPLSRFSLFPDFLFKVLRRRAALLKVAPVWGVPSFTPVALISFAYRGLMHVPLCGPCKSALCALNPEGAKDVWNALCALVHVFLYFLISIVRFPLFPEFLFRFPVFQANQ